LDAGALQAKSTREFPAVVVKDVGAPGTVAIRTEAEAVDGVDVPALFIALTLKL
jgi:hypothetical protein